MRYRDGTAGKVGDATHSKYHVVEEDGLGQDTGVTDQNGNLLSIYSLEKMYKERRLAFDVVLAGGFEYEDNDQATLHSDQFPTGYRIQNRWLIGQNFLGALSYPCSDRRTKSVTQHIVWSRCKLLARS